MTVNWRVAAISTVGFCGVTAIDNSTAGVTVSTVLALKAPVVAVICVAPATLPSAKPPAAMLAVAGVADAKAETAVTSCVVPSLNVPVTVNCCVPPMATDGVSGAMAMALSTAGDTVSCAVAAMPPNVALTAEPPAAMPVPRPVPGLTLALAGVAEVQAAFALTSCDEPSL